MTKSVAKSETAVDHVTQAVRQAVLDGQFQQGDRLVVADIAQRFGVSVGPVREAIRRLVGEGVLEFTPHRGATVPALSERDVRHIFQLREAIEGYAAKLAAENIHRADYAERMTYVLARLRETVHADPEVVSDVHQLFHDELYEIAGNPAIREAAMRLTFPLNRARFIALMGRTRVEASLREHELIIDAILAGDALRAERAMRAHLHSGAIAVCDALDSPRLSRPPSIRKGVTHE